MIHPDSELRFINEATGQGVVATKLIPCGTITWVADPLDQVFEATKADRLPTLLKPLFEKYSFVNGKGEMVLCWDHARFIHHSCQPTCLSTGFDFEVAVRDIAAGEELTDEYGTLNLAEPLQCYCGASCCRGVVQPGDILQFSAEWDSIAAVAFALIKTVERPLWPLVAEKQQVEDVLSGQCPLPSSLRHYCAYELER
jgi:uncharacterized protein